MRLSDTYYPAICRVKDNKVIIRMPDLFGDREFRASSIKQAQFIIQQAAQTKVWDLKLEKKEIPSPSKSYDLKKDKDEWILFIPVKI